MIKEIISDFKEYKEHLYDFINYHRLSIKIALAMKLADMMCYALNKQIRVVLNSRKHFECWSENTLKMRRKLGQIPKKWGAAELSSITFYLTPTSRNNTVPKEEREAFKAEYIDYMKMLQKRS